MYLVNPCKLDVATFSFIIAEASFTVFGILYLMHLVAKACCIAYIICISLCQASRCHMGGGGGGYQARML